MNFTDKDLENDLKLMGWHVEIIKENQSEYFYVYRGQKKKEKPLTIDEGVLKGNHFFDWIETCRKPFLILKKFKDRELLSEETFENYLSELVDKNKKLNNISNIFKCLKQHTLKFNVVLKPTLEKFIFFNRYNKKFIFKIDLGLQGYNLKYDFDSVINKIEEIKKSIESNNADFPEWQKIVLNNDFKNKLPKYREVKSKKFKI